MKRVPAATSAARLPEPRLAGPGDIGSLVALERAAFAEDAYDATQLLRFVTDSNCLVHVLDVAGAALGFAVTELIRLSDFAHRYVLPVDRLAGVPG